ncbi:MAG: glutamyl-Q tRNA(Asp) synthetase [Candidatus Endobugula sp.]|jgi:glutamyl-Q tRNA(Asp) synthetase
MHNNPTHAAYIGRFAPSPSGPLHFGSIATALASYLDAKHYHGQWLVRMEDIDPPREVDGAQDMILGSLLAHGLQWDGNIMLQSERSQTYQEALSTLWHYSYPCTCNRQRLNTLNGIYDGYCLHNKGSATHNEGEHLHTPKSATRLRTDIFNDQPQHLIAAEIFTDLFQQQQTQPLHTESGDFILHRKDGLFAYQLAVTIDDIAQGITHVIRGADLLSTTSRQRYLWTLLCEKLASNDNLHAHQPLPEYGHIPIATTTTGQKLSKQNNAAALDNAIAFDNLCRAFTFLCHPAPTNIIEQNSISVLLDWGVRHWNRERIPQVTAIAVKE